MTPDTFFDNLAFLADAPNGVQKLRELILQLAVQGKLVPQDSEDEPAPVLLERIQIEKERSRRVKMLSSPVREEEILSQIPNHWMWSRLEQVGEINPRNDLGDDVSVSFVPMALIPSEYGQPIRGAETRSWKEVKNSFTHFAENDVILAKITPCFQNGKSTVARGMANGVGAGTTELHVFRPLKDTVNQDFVLLYLKSSRFILEGATKMTGSAGQKRVPKEYFAHSPFPLPPRKEQNHIVAKVDKLMALCDELEAKQREQSEAREQLSNVLTDKILTVREPAEFDEHWQRFCARFDLLYDTPDTIGKLRQAILQLAVQGKLVQPDPEDEPVSILLKKINDKKERLIKEGKRKKTEALSSIKEEEHPFLAPEIWDWARFGEIADIASGVTLGRQLGGKQTVAYPYLRVANVQRGYLDLSKIKEVEILPSELDRYQLRKGDILLTEGGDWDKLGRAAIWKDQIPYCLHQNHIFRARPIVEEIQPQWIILYMNSFTGQRYFQEASKQTTNLASINMTQLRRCPIPLPPPKTQSQILAKVDQLMALCDGLEAKLKQARVGSETLAAVMMQGLLA